MPEPRVTPTRYRESRMKVAICAGLVLVSSGCAFSNVHLELPTSVPHHLSGGDQRQLVVVMPFADERPDKNRCGMQKNQYNADTAAALCTPEPATWIASLLATELRAAGFAVVEQRGAAKPSALVVSGTLLKLFVEPVSGSLPLRSKPTYRFG